MYGREAREERITGQKSDYIPAGDEPTQFRFRTESRTHSKLEYFERRHPPNFRSRVSAGQWGDVGWGKESFELTIGVDAAADHYMRTESQTSTRHDRRDRVTSTTFNCKIYAASNQIDFLCGRCSQLLPQEDGTRLHVTAALDRDNGPTGNLMLNTPRMPSSPSSTKGCSIIRSYCNSYSFRR